MQPWATLVAIRGKQLETRTWGTKYRGPLAIHASKSYPSWAKALFYNEPYYSILLGAGFVSPDELPAGAVIAVCDLWDCRKIKSHRAPPEPERSFGDFSIGRYVWCFEHMEAIKEPVIARGGLGLWDFKQIEQLPDGIYQRIASNTN